MSDVIYSLTLEVSIIDLIWYFLINCRMITYLLRGNGFKDSAKHKITQTATNDKFQAITRKFTWNLKCPSSTEQRRRDGGDDRNIKVDILYHVTNISQVSAGLKMWRIIAFPCLISGKEGRKERFVRRLSSIRGGDAFSEILHSSRLKAEIREGGRGLGVPDSPSSDSMSQKSLHQSWRDLLPNTYYVNQSKVPFNMIEVVAASVGKSLGLVSSAP